MTAPREQAFLDHPLWPQIEALREQLDGLPGDLDADNQAHLTRLRWLANLVEEYRDGVDPEAIPAQWATIVQAAMLTVTNTVSQFLNQAQPTYLQQAAGDQADQVLTALYQVPTLTQQKTARAVRKTMDEAHAASEAALTGLREQIEALTEQVGVAQQRLTDLATAGDQRTATSDVAVEAKLGELVASVDAQIERGVLESARLDAAITDQQAIVLTAETKRTQAWTEQLTGAAREVSDAVEQSKQDFAEALAERQTAAEATVTEMDALHEKAKDLLEATGRRAITTEYGAYAQREGQAALAWTLTTVAFALLGFAFIVFEILRLGDQAPSLAATVLKITGSLALLAAAGYTGKQGAEHRRQQRDAKRMQLDINAVEPFLSRLPDEQQIELRAKIADRVFARPPEHDKPEPDASGVQPVVDIVVRALKQYNNKT